MELVAHRIELPKWGTKLYIHLITDVHREAAGCDATAFRRDIRKIREANERKDGKQIHYWIGGGDWNNGIGTPDKRFDGTAVSTQFQKYLTTNLHMAVCRQLVREASPIKEWCLGYGRGNHEDGVIKYNQFDPADYVARSLDTNYLGYSAGIRITIGIEGTNQHRDTIFIYWHHGYGASRSKGGKKNMLYNLRDQLVADVYMTGHVHEPEAFEGTRMHLTVKGQLRQVARNILFINGGTYQKNYMPEGGVGQVAGEYNEGHQVEVDYAEKKAYTPSVIGHYGFSFQFFKERQGEFSVPDEIIPFG